MVKNFLALQPSIHKEFDRFLYITMFGNHRHALYSLIWIFSVIELGLTAYRIHKTRQAGYHEPIVAELLSVSIFTLLWIPIASLLIRRATSATGNAGQTSTMHHHGETIGNAIIWLMWLVGAAIATVSILK